MSKRLENWIGVTVKGGKVTVKPVFSALIRCYDLYFKEDTCI